MSEKSNINTEKIAVEIADKILKEINATRIAEAESANCGKYECGVDDCKPPYNCSKKFDCDDFKG